MLSRKASQTWKLTFQAALKANLSMGMLKIINKTKMPLKNHHKMLISLNLNLKGIALIVTKRITILNIANLFLLVNGKAIKISVKFIKLTILQPMTAMITAIILMMILVRSIQYVLLINLQNQLFLILLLQNWQVIH